jgi:hypothetical protein
MRRLWRWLQDNSRALEGAAAVILVLGGFVSVSTYLWRTLRPEIVVRITRSERVSLPPRTAEWVKSIVAAVETLPKEKEKESTAARQRLDALAFQGKLREFPERTRTTLEILNQSNRVIPGVRVRFIGFLGLLPEFGFSATFLGDEEAQRYLAKIRDLNLNSARDVLLPALPELPPGGIATLEMYSGYFNEIDISAPGATAKFIDVVKETKLGLSTGT